MFKSFVVINLVCLIMCIQGFSQSSAQSTMSAYTYHPASSDKTTWQRLNLLLSACYFRSFAGRDITFDSCLIYVSRLLGISRLAVLAEGFDDPELLAQSQWFDKRKPGEAVTLLSNVKGKKHLQLLLLLGSYYAFENRGHRHHMDSIEYFLKRAVNESKLINEKKLGRQALSILCKIYAQAGDTVNRNITFRQLTEECNIAKDKRTMAAAFIFRGLCEVFAKGTVITQDMADDLIKRRIGYLDRAIALYREMNDIEGEILGLVNSGYYYIALDESDNGYGLIKRALELEDSIAFPYTHYTTDNLAMITMNQNKFGEPLKYSLETVRTAEKVKDSVAWPNFYARLGELYSIEDGREDESLKWMHKALERYILIKHSNLYYTLINIVSIMYQIEGRQKEALDLVLKISEKYPPVDSVNIMDLHMAFAVAYLGVKEYRLAEKHTKSADSIINLATYGFINHSLDMAMINSTFGAIYFEDGQFLKAKKYLEKYFADDAHEVVITNDLAAYERLIKIDSVFHDYHSAVNHYKKYVALLDSNFRTSKLRQAEELRIMYETQDKEIKINLLNEQAKLEKASLTQAMLIKNITVAGIIAVLIIAGLLYRQSWLRKKHNKVITRENELQEQLLTEKEWLLKEIHHRVKNNLQIVMSLLNSQSAYTENDAALSAIHDSQHRVHAMSLIHQKLYLTENVSSIDMSSYIRELVSYLGDSFDIRQRIRFEYNLEHLELDVSQAVPLGLILNEAITNSIKYAFPDERDGTISISLSNVSSGHYLLSIADNGIGIPAHITDIKPGSLGMSLMAGLSEDLDGKFTIENNNGTVIKISFLHDLTIKRPGISPAPFVSSN